MRPSAKRIRDLERRALGLAAGPSGRSEAMERLVEHLGRLAALRRGELSEEEEAEVTTADAGVRRRMAEIRGGGGLT
jgi:hypothetical protein